MPKLILWVKVDPKKAFKACELSFTKYCSVSKMLEDKAKVSFSVFVNARENTKFEIFMLCLLFYNFFIKHVGKLVKTYHDH